MTLQDDQIRTMKIRIGALERIIRSLIKNIPESQRNVIIHAAINNPLRDPQLLNEENEMDSVENDFIRWISS